MRLIRAAVALLLVAGPAAGQNVPPSPNDADRNDWQAYYAVGVDLLRRQPRRAVRYFEHAARLEPMAAAPWIGLVAAFWREHEGLARRRAEEDPLIERMDEVQEADGWLDRAYALNPFAPLGLMSYTLPRGYRYSDRSPFHRGAAAFLRNDFERAQQDLTIELVNAPDNWEAYHWRAMARVHLGDYDGAVHDLEALIEAVEAFRETHTIYGPADASALFYALAMLAARANDRARAVRAFEQALTDDIANAWAHLHFATLLWVGRDTARALEEYAAAAELAPEEPAVLASYGTVLLEAGRFEEALAHLDRAIDINPWWARPRFNRAVCLERLGRGAEAHTAWGDYLERAPERDETQRANAEARRAELRT